jgi:hypothetical protein
MVRVLRSFPALDRAVHIGRLVHIQKKTAALLTRLE